MHGLWLLGNIQYQCSSSHNYIHSLLSLTTGGGGDSENWRVVDGLLENAMFQESKNCGKNGYTHTCIVGF